MELLTISSSSPKSANRSLPYHTKGSTGPGRSSLAAILSGYWVWPTHNMAPQEDYINLATFGANPGMVTLELSRSSRPITKTYR